MEQQDFFKRFNYDVRKDKVGGGSFGTVYKANDNVLHRDVAIKVSEVKIINGKEFSLKDEFDAIKNLPKHPNIANYEELHTFETPYGVFDYAIMQFYPDGNLSAAIKRGMSEEQKVDLATSLLEGISHLHKFRVFHRDLKPGNILIINYSNKIIPVITDFGLSKQVTEDAQSRISNSFGGGTLKYSSPEQLRGDDIRLNTDLWSYGAIIYEIFTGKPLFKSVLHNSASAEAEKEILEYILSKNVDAELNQLPGVWSEIAKKCLIKDPAKRIKTTEDIYAMINSSEQQVENDDTYIQGQDTNNFHSDSTISTTTNQNKNETKPSKINYLLYGIIGVLALILIIVIINSNGTEDELKSDIYNLEDEVETLQGKINEFSYITFKVGENGNLSSGSYDHGYFMHFTTYYPITLESVYVKSNSTGYIDISVYDSYGNLIETVEDLYISSSYTWTNLSLYVDITAPGDYYLAFTGNPALYYLSSGHNYANYNNGLLEITGSSNNLQNRESTSYYQYFFNWSVKLIVD